MASGGNNGPNSKSPKDLSHAFDAIYEEIIKQNPLEAIPTPKKKPDPDPDNLYKDFYEASKKLDEKISELKSIGTDKGILIKSTPGIGKTEGGLHLLSILAKEGTMPFFASPTRNMMWQGIDRIKGGFYGQGHRVIALEGRHGGYVRRRYEDNGTLTEIKVEANCYCYDKICKSRERGYPAQHHVCASCPYWPLYKDANGEKTGFYGACEYFKDLYRAAGFVPFGSGNWAPIVFTTHHMAASVCVDSEILKPKFLMFDEDPTTALRDIYGWDEYELERKIDGDALSMLRVLLKRAIEVAKRFKLLAKFPVWTDKIKALPDDEKAIHKTMIASSHDDNTVSLSGIGLAQVLGKAAKELGVNLDLVLEAAAISTTGVEKGELYDVPAWRFQRLPHYKEPDLAEEIQRVVNESKEGKETAYKVSIRKTAEEPWSVYWDCVRRMKYGGPLVFLDAYGERVLYERICNRPVDVIEVRCKIRKNVTVHHYPIKTSRKMMDDPHERLSLFYNYVVPILRKSKGKKVLFYIQKRYADWLDHMIEAGDFGLESCVIKWFWMDRGDDSYGDFDKLIIFGSPFSNIIADRHFANAMFFGEEPLDFSRTSSGYKDERVRLLKQSREENEAMQALFRVRPAKPREDSQEMLILSQIKLPIDFEMKGATQKLHYEPDFDKEGIAKGIHRLFKRFGFWTDTMSAFIYDVDGLIDWFDEGGISSKREFPVTYDDVLYRMKSFGKNYHFLQARSTLFESMLDLPAQVVDFRGRKVRAWGDVSKAWNFLEQLRLATREPGLDDDESPEDGSDHPDTEAPNNPDIEQLEKEAMIGNDDSEEGGGFTADALKIMALLAQGGSGPPVGVGKKGKPNSS